MCVFVYVRKCVCVREIWMGNYLLIVIIEIILLAIFDIM